MQIVIDIPEKVVTEEDYIGFFKCLSPKLYEVITNGKPLPKGHGRLIDADALIKNSCFYETEMDLRDNAPTIIEADKEGEDDRD